MDPNAPQVPNPDPEPESLPPAPEPEAAPQIDLDTAYNVITQHEGWDPRLTRYEIQEHKRRVQEFERERRAFEEERQRQWQPPEDTGDPYMQRIGRLERLLLEDRERNRKREEEAERAARVGNELHSAYTQMARQTGLTREQMEQRSTEFYDVLADLYPDPEMVQRIGADRAVRAAFRVFSGQGNGVRSSAPQVNGRGPTASITMPRAVQAQPPPSDDGGPQRPGESLEDYVMRRRAWREQNNVQVKLREGVRYSSE